MGRARGKQIATSKLQKQQRDTRDVVAAAAAPLSLSRLRARDICRRSTCCCTGGRHIASSTRVPLSLRPSSALATTSAAMIPAASRSVVRLAPVPALLHSARNSCGHHHVNRKGKVSIPGPRTCCVSFACPLTSVLSASYADIPVSRCPWTTLVSLPPTMSRTCRSSEPGIRRGSQGCRCTRGAGFPDHGFGCIDSTSDSCPHEGVDHSSESVYTKSPSWSLTTRLACGTGRCSRSWSRGSRYHKTG